MDSDSSMSSEQSRKKKSRKNTSRESSPEFSEYHPQLCRNYSAKGHKRRDPEEDGFIFHFDEDETYWDPLQCKYFFRSRFTKFGKKPVRKDIGAPKESRSAKFTRGAAEASN